MKKVLLMFILIFSICITIPENFLQNTPTIVLAKTNNSKSSKINTTVGTKIICILPLSKNQKIKKITIKKKSFVTVRKKKKNSIIITP